MSNPLHTFNDILNLHLRPWKNNLSPQKFQQLLNELKKETYQYQPHCDVDFPKPVNDKRRYYHTLIENAAITFLNSLHKEIETRINDDEKTFRVSTTLGKQLKSKFSEVDSLIGRRNYQLENIIRTNDDAYIIQYLKYQLVRLYLEVQESYPEELKDEPLTQEDILSNFFSDPTYSNSIINEATELYLPKTKPALSIQPDEPGFIPMKKDVREPKKGIMQYHDIIKHPDRFARFEEELFSNKYIDHDYNFLNPYGQMQEMGGIFQVLIKKGYFLERNFTLNKKITSRDISKFLDRRYNTSLDKQFRYWNDKPQELADLMDKYHWLDTLPLS
jgi:hypothetical protein